MAEGRRPSYYSINSSRFSGLLIANLVITNTKLGKGAYATVYQADWNGTPCAAKRLHQILLEDEAPGGTEKLLSNFEAECLTWSRLRHPGVVQFLGVYLEEGSCLPVLIMEMMDTSLRKFLEVHKKEDFPLNLKAFVLHQITQALAYLHSQNPPLVHHDLSPNNVLLNRGTFVTKLSDFGMSHAVNPSVNPLTSIKGTTAFMSPEALQSPPQYDEKLDVFSFGNVILSTITHKWPEPCPPTHYKGDQLIALDEFQRREQYVEDFTAQEKQLFLSTVRQCLENMPHKRPFSVTLVEELRHIESTLSSDNRVATPAEQVYEQLLAKNKECKQKAEVIREKDEALREKNEALRKKDEALRKKDEALREVNKTLWKKEELIRDQDEIILGKNEALQHQDMLNRKLDEALTEKDTINRAQQDTIRALQASIQMQQDMIRSYQAEVEYLRSPLAVTHEVS